MSDESLLLLCLVLFYVLECVCLVRRDEIAFVPSLRGEWRIRRGIDAYGNENWGILVNHPIPYCGYAVICQEWPFSASGEGVFSYVVQTPNPGRRPDCTARFHRYSEIERVEAQAKSVTINGELFIRTGSHAAAVKGVDLIEQLRKAAPEKRGRLIDRHLAATTDTAAIQRSISSCEKLTHTLLSLCTGLFVYTFILIPLAIWRSGLEATWLPLLAILLVLNGATAACFWLAHKRLHPAHNWERLSAIVSMVLFPLATMRAHDRLWRQALSGFHPLAVARILCNPAVYRDLAGRVARDLAFPIEPLCPPDCPEAAATASDFYARVTAVLHRLIEEAGDHATAFLKEPARDEDGSKCYCPRCRMQFIVEAGTCEPCGSMALRPFASDRQPEAAGVSGTDS